MNHVVSKWLLQRVAAVILLPFLIWFLFSETVPSEFVYFTPHLTTLIVLSSASQRLRIPQANGKPYRKGELN